MGVTKNRINPRGGGGGRKDFVIEKSEKVILYSPIYILERGRKAKIFFVSLKCGDIIRIV
jgi:hypothetical protein